MTLRKVAGLLAAFGITVGLIGSGVGAAFQGQVTANEDISVGTFSCQIVDPSMGTISADHTSVTYTVPPITSSAAGSAPFSFTVKNTGSITQVLTVGAPTQGGALGGDFSAMPASPSPVGLAAGASQVITTGIQWSTLTNDDLGRTGSMTWTVTCGEAGQVILDNTASVLPSNLPSFGVEAYYFNEWGAGATFAGSARHLSTATVTLSSWACQTGNWTDGSCVTTPGATYNVPITFKIYNVGPSNTVGSVIVSKTVTFAVPYRPSADATHCTGVNAHKWWDGTACFNGLAHDVTFIFAAETLPDNAIFGISYNSDTNGYSPLHGSNSPTDSLNIAVYPDPGTGPGTPAVAPSVGTWLPDGLQVYGAHSVADGGSGVFTGPETNVSNDMTGPFGGYMPAVQITATN